MKKVVSFFASLGSFLIFWELVSLFTQNRSLPTPLETFVRLKELGPEILLHTGASFLRIFIALGIALLVGVPLGILFGRVKLVQKIFGPLVYFLYPLPKVAFLPVFMLFFGLGNTSKIILIFSVISFQVIVSIRDGVAQIPESYFQVLENYPTTWWHRLRFLIFPAIVPYLFSSIRVSVGISLASLFFAENYNTKYGLGYLILSAWGKMDYTQMLGGIFMIALGGFVLFRGLDDLEKKFGY